MTLMELIVCLVIGGACAAATCAITGNRAGALVVFSLVGFVGAFVGSWLAHEVHLPPLFAVTVGGRAFALLWPVVGSAVLVAGAKVLVRPHHDVAHLDRYER